MKVKFVPQNVEFEIKPGESVLHVAQDHNIYVKSVCKGVPSCAECRVRIIDGEHNVLPPGSEERSLIGTGHFIDRRRLSCQLRCFGDITIDMTEQIAKSQGLIGGQKKKKLAAKDDRIEDVHAIRAEVTEDESMSEEEARSEELVRPEPLPREPRGPKPQPRTSAPQNRPGPQPRPPDSPQNSQQPSESEPKKPNARRRRRRK